MSASRKKRARRWRRKVREHVVSAPLDASWEKT